MKTLSRGKRLLLFPFCPGISASLFFETVFIQNQWVNSHPFALEGCMFVCVCLVVLLCRFRLLLSLAAVAGRSAAAACRCRVSLSFAAAACRLRLSLLFLPLSLSSLSLCPRLVLVLGRCRCRLRGPRTLVFLHIISHILQGFPIKALAALNVPKWPREPSILAARISDALWGSHMPKRH